MLDTAVRSRALHRELPVVLWTTAGHDHDDPLPLLVAHDGVEYAERSGLLTVLERAVARGRVPACHVALLHPVDRDAIYSASAAYARALVNEVIPHVEERVARRGARVGMGPSLGGLAMLHAHRLYPDSFDALFLQSASLFVPGVDDHERRRLEHYWRIVRFVRGVLGEPAGPRPIPVVMTCGVQEENIHGDRAVARALRQGGYDARLVEARGGHDWAAWRATFDPHLIGLLSRVFA